MQQLLLQASRNLSWFIQEFIFFLRKQWFFVGILPLTCLAYSINTYLGLERYYQAEASFVFDYMHKKFYGEQIIQLSNWKREGELALIQQKTGLTPKEIDALISIKALNVFKKPLQEDFTTAQLPFYIQVRVKDKKILPNIEKSLLHFFNEHEFTKKEINRVLETNQKKLVMLEQDIRLLNTLSSQDSVASFFETADNLEKFFAIKEKKFQEQEEAKAQVLKTEAVSLLAGFSGTSVSPMQQFLSKGLKISFVFVALLGLYFLGFVMLQNSKNA